MHLLVFAAYYSPHQGGYEKYIEETSKRLVAMGMRITVVTCDTESVGQFGEHYGITIIRIPCWNMLGGTFVIPKPSPALFSLWKYVQAENVEVINTHTRFFLTTTLGWLLAKTSRRKLVHTEHGTRHVILPAIVPRFIAWVFDHTLGYLVIRSANSVIAISKASGEFARHLGAKQYKIAYNGVNTSFFYSIQRESKLESCHEEKTILYVGRLISAKGVQDLIKSFHLIQENDAYRVKLIIAGDGNFKKQLQLLAQSNTNILFLGSQTQEQLRHLYQETTIFVNPSYSEGLPTSVLEAGACGCAVIATQVGGTSEIITHGQNGYLFQPGDNVGLTSLLERLLCDANLRMRLGQALQKKVSNTFNWDDIASKYYKLLSQQYI